MKQEQIGFAFCGSFCTHEKVLQVYEELCRTYDTVIPIVSPAVEGTDTRFGQAEAFLQRVEQAAGRRAIHTVKEAEPIGPGKLLDVLIVCPCTGNTLAKLAHGIADGPVTMACKSHLRNARPLVLALATNDGLSAAAPNIGTLMARRNVYFVPLGQDDPAGKPTSLIAHMDRLPDTVRAALEGRQLQPVLL